MVAERHGVDRIGADQFLDVDDVAVFGILGAGAGPEHALCLRAFGCESFPARSAENALITLIGELAVRDRDFAEQTLESNACWLASVVFLSRSFSMESISVSMRLMKKLATLGHLLEIAAALCEIFESRDIGLGNLLVNFLREQQRDVDVDAFTDQLPNCGKTFGSARAP